MPIGSLRTFLILIFISVATVPAASDENGSGGFPSLASGMGEPTCFHEVVLEYNNSCAIYLNKDTAKTRNCSHWRVQFSVKNNNATATGRHGSPNEDYVIFCDIKFTAISVNVTVNWTTSEHNATSREYYEDEYEASAESLELFGNTTKTFFVVLSPAKNASGELPIKEEVSSVVQYAFQRASFFGRKNPAEGTEEKGRTVQRVKAAVSKQYIIPFIINGLIIAGLVKGIIFLRDALERKYLARKKATKQADSQAAVVP